MEDISYLIVGLVAGWLSLCLGFWLFRQGRNWWNKQHHGLPIDHGVLLVEFGSKLASAHDEETISKVLIEELPSRLLVERSEFLLADSNRLASKDSNGLSLPVSHAAVRKVASSGEAQRSDRGQLQVLIQQGKTDLDWTEVWVPMMRGSKLHGMWLLGRRKDGVNFAPEDLHWLTSIAREAAVVLEVIRFAKQERLAASEMRELYRQMVKTRELERGRISRELHDGVLQDLSAVTRDLRALGANGDVDGDSFSGLAELSGETVRVLRAICNDLRPPLLRQDLGSALKALIMEMDGRSSVPIHIELSVQMEDLKLFDETALAIFRIVQEAVNNAIQHADASEIAVRLTAYPDRLRLTVTDDGKGIPGSVESARFVAEGHYGLAGMRERAAMVGGKLEVQTAVDYGTVVIFELPQ